MPDNKYPLTLQDVKNYLRVDFNEDDVLIEVMMDTAQQYIRDAVGKWEETNPRHNMIMLAVVAHLYENRMLQGQSSGKIVRIISSMMLQERLEEYSDESEDTD